MDEWDRVLSHKPTENPSPEARRLATKLYADELMAAKKKDAEENGTYFQDILMKNREFKINLIAKCYQTILNESAEKEQKKDENDFDVWG